MSPLRIIRGEPLPYYSRLPAQRTAAPLPLLLFLHGYDEGEDHVGSARLAYSDVRTYSWLLSHRVKADG